MNDLKGSPALSLSMDDGWKVLKGALIAAAGAALTYLAEWVSGADFGQYTPAVVAIAGVLVNLARKWLLDTSTLTLFVAFVLSATACQAACRHITPMPTAYPADGQVILGTMSGEVDSFWSTPITVRYGNYDWNADNATGKSGGKSGGKDWRCWASFARGTDTWTIHRAWKPAPLLFDPHTGSKLP